MARLQPASEVAEVVDRTTVRACNKQTDRHPHYGQGGGSAHCRSVNAVSSGPQPTLLELE